MRKQQTVERAQQGKVFVPKPTNPGLTSETHMVEGESQPLIVILSPPHICAHGYYTPQSQRHSMSDNQVVSSDQLDFTKTVILFIWRVGSKCGEEA